MADVILDRQRDYPANVSRFPVAYLLQAIAKEQIIFPHGRGVVRS